MLTSTTLNKTARLFFLLSIFIHQDSYADINFSEPLSFLPKLNMRAFAGADSFRGLPDAGFEDNSGINLGIEGAYPLTSYQGIEGLGLQLGASYGAYNFAGKGHYRRHAKKIESQTFLTLGAFKECSGSSPWSFGVAYDGMLADNFSVLAQAVWLSQWRLRTSFFISPLDELGANVSLHTHSFNKTYHFSGCRYKVSFTCISQATAFWRHFYRGEACTTLWVGAPLANRLDQSHSRRPGRFIIGGEISVPFCSSWELTGRAQYMHPASKKRSAASYEYGTNVAFAIYYNFGKSCVGTSCAQPYMPLANNSNFLIDARAHAQWR